MEAGSLEIVSREMEKYRLDILGLSEVRWKDCGELKIGNETTFLYSGQSGEHAEHRNGVGIMLRKNAVRSLLEWKPVSDRIITARFNAQIRNVTLVQCYAPTDVSDQEMKEEFYRKLSEVVSSISTRDILIVMGDLNAKVGSNNEGFEHIMGSHGVGDMNDNGWIFANFCAEHDLVIGGTIFPHKLCHRITWVSSDGFTENQIDQFAMTRKFRSSLTDVRNYRGADANSDHHLVIAKIRLKIMASINKFKQRDKRYDIGKLRNVEVKESFQIELRNRYELLRGLHPCAVDVDEEWNRVREVIGETTETILGIKNYKKKEWMSEETWESIKKRKNTKDKLNKCKTRAQKLEVQKQYTEMQKNVKKAVRKDKRQWIDDQANKAELAANMGDSKELYRITKLLSRKGYKRQRPVRDEQGALLTSAVDQIKRWEQHFGRLLNPVHEEGDVEDLVHLQKELDSLNISTDSIDQSPPSITEIQAAIEGLKNGKAPGSDRLPPEVLKCDAKLTASILEPVFRRIWDEESIPTEWKKGLIIKLPKKGDATRCDNWRGITLLSVPSKILAKIILNRIKDQVELHLRKEQAGFRKHRSCVDLINTLRIILEQSTEWQSPLYTVFVDFQKAFDSVNRDVMWKILKCYGFPDKILNLIKGMYDNFECEVVHEGKLSNPIPVTAGVRQGCILSPTLFIIVLDVLMRSVLGGRKLGIQWGLRNRLEDLDYADDICLLAQRFGDIVAKLNKLNRYSRLVGLKININKTKDMRVNEVRVDRLLIEDQVVEKVETFQYLGSIVTANGGADEDVQSRIRKANGSFVQLYPIWKNKNISIRTKIRLFNSNVKSVLLYGCETWRVTASITQKLQSFVNRCLRRILNVWWPDKISNEELWARTDQSKVALEIKKRKWNWIGHTLRKPAGAIERQAVDWNPQGVRRRGRPRKTWRRSVEEEARSAGKSWTQVRALAQDRRSWRIFTEALCSNGS